jgi:cytochrome c-type biogenesis protein CcmF
LIAAVGVGMHTAWRSASLSDVGRRLRLLALAAVIAGVAIPTLVYGGGGLLTMAGVTAGVWLLGASLRDPVLQMLGRGPRLTQAGLGMCIAHFGLGLCVLGITVTSAFNVISDQRIGVGETVQAGEHTVRFVGTRPVMGPNYRGLRAEMEVSRAGVPVATLYPEKRTYLVRSSPMTEAGIDAGWSRDLFVALGDDLGENAWSVRIQYKPLVRFIWLGALVMALGGLVAATDRRYRERGRVAAAADQVQAARA